MAMRKTLAGIVSLMTAIGLNGCSKDTSEKSSPQDQSNVSTYQGIVTGVDNDNANYSHGKMAFVLDNTQIFGSPNLYEKEGGHSRADGPAGMMGLSARLESAQQSRENVCVRAIKMHDGGYRIVSVTFSDDTTYNVKPNIVK